MLTPNRKPITNFVKQTYHVYFSIYLGDQDRVWAPDMVCKSCTEYLRQWTKGTKNSLKFGILMVWMEQSNHATDCCFCAIDLTGINNNNRSSLKYSDLDSARHPVALCENTPIPVYAGLLYATREDDSSSVETEVEEAVVDSDATRRFSQEELNDLVRDPGLSKASSELLASRLKEKRILSVAASPTFAILFHD